MNNYAEKIMFDGGPGARYAPNLEKPAIFINVTTVLAPSDLLGDHKGIIAAAPVAVSTAYYRPHKPLFWILGNESDQCLA
jgi:hypothetical protein